MAERILWNEGWGFRLCDDQRIKDLDFDSSALSRVGLPHDWSVALPFTRDEKYKASGFLQGGVGWYRKELYLTKEEAESCRYRLYLEGVFHVGTVYVNGAVVGSRPYGYFPGTFHITPFLKEGLNVVAIRVDHSRAETSRWYNGSGIFRDVWLLKTGETYIQQDGIWVRTPVVTDAYAQVEIQVLANLGHNPSIEATCQVADGDGQVVAWGKAQKDGGGGYAAKLKIEGPRLWSVKSPCLYQLSVTLTAKGEILDLESVPFGIRKLEWVPQKGLFLNHVPIKLKGVCLHQDAGIVGGAVTRSLLEQRLALLKAMGCNAIRTAHHPWGSMFYELCDQMGFLVLDELFDGWENTKAKSDYGLFFKEWHRQDLAAIVKRDRNHPSVILWSIGNEVAGMEEETLLELKHAVEELDPDRPVTCGIQGTGGRPDACRSLLPVAGYNDGGGACFIYERDHKQRPNQLMVATESPHTLQTRGFYRTQTWWRDKNQPRKEVENLRGEEIFFDGGPCYYSSYDNAGVRLSARDCWNQTLKLDYLVGEFRWTGFDYYGESWGWPARSIGMGVVDTAGIPKDHYYLYQSMWIDKEEQPILHMLPHWTHHGLELGTAIPIWVYTNCDSVELYLNGRSLGRKDRREEGFIQYNVPYEPGSLLAAARIGEEIVKETEWKTAGAPQILGLEWVNQKVCKSPKDFREIRASILDGQGVEVPHGESAITFFGTGVRILGTENGDHTDMTPLASKVRKAFYGKCMVLAEGNWEGDGGPGLYAAAVLGERYFDHEAVVTAVVEEIDRWGVQREPECRIRCRQNGGEWFACQGSFPIWESSVIEAEVKVKGQPAIRLRGEFIKGKRPAYVDVAHGNRQIASQVPPGPFSPKLAGLWDMEGQILDFHGDGNLDLVIPGSSRQRIGWWWYDFPVDAFEAPGYAGTGEIWFLSGEKAVVELGSQDADEAVIDNREHGFQTPYGKKARLSMRRCQFYEHFCLH